MATNPTKWKLNKAETKELEDQAARFYEELIAKGKEKKRHNLRGMNSTRQRPLK
jgi:hypothetical protein